MTSGFLISERDLVLMGFKTTRSSLPWTHFNHRAIWPNDEMYLSIYRIKSLWSSNHCLVLKMAEFESYQQLIFHIYVTSSTLHHVPFHDLPYGQRWIGNNQGVWGVFWYEIVLLGVFLMLFSLVLIFVSQFHKHNQKLAEDDFF